MSFLYNLWSIVFRTAFKGDLTEYWHWFLLFDWIADLIYLVDIAIQFHVGYLEQGILVTDTQKLRSHYYQSSKFYRDIASVFPVFAMNLLLWSWTDHPLIIARFPRFLKLTSLIKFFDMSDTHTSLPHFLRALRLTLYLMSAIHWLACFYYMISAAEGFGTNDWVYPTLEGGDATLTRKYIRCLYWSMLTLTAIGETPTPSTNLEYVVTGLTFLVGILIFAAVVGNVGDVVSNMNASRMDFQSKLDCIKQYMNHRNVPEVVQSRVKKWLNYSWSRTQALNETDLLTSLPGQLRTEIAIHVHLDTLKKVNIFANCERGFLCGLVVKLRSQIFSPGDYICREGDVGKEMYIINHGRVEIIIREAETNQRIVVRTMIEGSYFGEISLLKLDNGCNKNETVSCRRTADVRSVGYSELFILSKKDLMQALRYYPEAREILEKEGRERLKDHKSQPETTSPPPINEEDEEESAGPLISARAPMGNGMSDEMKQVLQQLKQFDSLASRHWLHQLETKCQNLEASLSRQETEMRQKDEELARLQSSNKEMGKMLLAVRERKLERDHSGTTITNGFLDVDRPKKRRSKRKLQDTDTPVTDTPVVQHNVPCVPIFDLLRQPLQPVIEIIPPCTDSKSTPSKLSAREQSRSFDDDCSSTVSELDSDDTDLSD